MASAVQPKVEANRASAPEDELPGTLLFPKRLLHRRTLWREQLRPVFGDAHIVLEPHAKLSPDVNPGLIAERHVGCEFQRVPAHQIRPLVSIHADAVPHTVREEFVVRSVTAIVDYFPRRSIDRAALDSRLCR